jgi:diguanylate cyclase (GGDEF)-like protein/PAS domain S-box-containing protein
MGQNKRKTISQKPGSQPRAELNDLRQRLADLEITLAEHIQGDGLHETQPDHRILLDESSDPIFTFYPDGRYRYVNKAFAKGVGKEMDEIIGQKIWDIFPKEEADKRFAVVKWVFENAETKIIEVRVPRAEGDTYYLTTVKPILNDSKQVVSVICISKEITERKLMEQELKHLSTHDNLTSLYNRNFFETEMTRIQSGRLFPISIVVADVDNLKTVNDKFGHSAGDELLRKVALQLRKSFRGDDIVARIGGDEFAVLLPQMDEEATAAIVVRLRKGLENLNDPTIRLSIGLAIGREGSNLSEVMRLADDRMYQDKYAHKKAKGLDPFSQ